MKSLFCQVVLLMLGVATLSGCGSTVAAGPDPASFIAVKGVVTLDGKPLDGAMVVFFPQDAKMGDGGTSVTEASGEYELKTNGATGAVPGNYRVMISRLVDAFGKPVIATPETPPANLGARESLPSRYSDYTATTLKVKVTPQGGSFDFKLTSK